MFIGVAGDDQERLRHDISHRPGLVCTPRRARFEPGDQCGLNSSDVRLVLTRVARSPSGRSTDMYAAWIAGASGRVVAAACHRARRFGAERFGHERVTPVLSLDLWSENVLRDRRRSSDHLRRIVLSRARVWYVRSKCTRAGYCCTWPAPDRWANTERQTSGSCTMCIDSEVVDSTRHGCELHLYRARSNQDTMCHCHQSHTTRVQCRCDISCKRGASPSDRRSVPPDYRR